VRIVLVNFLLVIMASASTSGQIISFEFFEEDDAKGVEECFFRLLQDQSNTHLACVTSFLGNFTTRDSLSMKLAATSENVFGRADARKDYDTIEITRYPDRKNSLKYESFEYLDVIRACGWLPSTIAIISVQDLEGSQFMNQLESLFGVPVAPTWITDDQFVQKHVFTPITEVFQIQIKDISDDCDYKTFLNKELAKENAAVVVSMFTISADAASESQEEDCLHDDLKARNIVQAPDSALGPNYTNFGFEDVSAIVINCQAIKPGEELMILLYHRAVIQEKMNSNVHGSFAVVVKRKEEVRLNLSDLSLQ